MERRRRETRLTFMILTARRRRETECMHSLTLLYAPVPSWSPMMYGPINFNFCEIKRNKFVWKKAYVISEMPMPNFIFIVFVVINEYCFNLLCHHFQNIICREHRSQESNECACWCWFSHAIKIWLSRQHEQMNKGKEIDVNQLPKELAFRSVW